MTAVEEAPRRFPRGGECQCVACGVFFTSLSAFDSHFARGSRNARRTGDRPVECLNPEAAGLVCYQRAGGPTWGASGEANPFGGAS